MKDEPRLVRNLFSSKENDNRGDNFTTLCFAAVSNFSTPRDATSNIFQSSIYFSKKDKINIIFHI